MVYRDELSLQCAPYFLEALGQLRLVAVSPHDLWVEVGGVGAVEEAKEASEEADELVVSEEAKHPRWQKLKIPLSLIS